MFIKPKQNRSVCVLPVDATSEGKYSTQNAHSFARGPRPVALFLSGSLLNLLLSSRYSFPYGVCMGHISKLAAPGARLGSLKK